MNRSPAQFRSELAEWKVTIAKYREPSLWRATWQILNTLGVPFKGINVLDSNDIRQGIKDYTNWPTIPQLYVKGEFVGGSDILMEMFQSGELKQLLTEKGVVA